MEPCFRCLGRNTAFHLQRSTWKSIPLHRLRSRSSRLASTSALRTPVLFFSSNLGTSFAPELDTGSDERWRSDTAGSSASERDSQASPDVPFVPHPSLPTEYPPPPFDLYKPVPALTPRRLVRIYVQLSKARLTSLVVLTAMSGVALSPFHAGVTVLLSTALGTALCAASANTINQILESPFDAQMARTRNRPLVRRAITPLHAAGFAAATGIAGPAILLTMVNPITAALGTLNIVLYAGVYTLMKRRTIWNTWVGSVVGAIPPVMGWTSCGGHIIPSSTYPINIFPPSLPASLESSISTFTSSIGPATIDNPLAPIALFAFLFSWQFPHFNALSHLLRASYAQAGYHMLCVTSPSHNALVSLRHATLLLPICSVLVPASGLTTWAFAVTSLPINLMAIRSAWRFWKQGTDARAKDAWHQFLWYLPVMLGLMMFHKRSWFDEVEGDADGDDQSGWVKWAKGLMGQSTRAEVVEPVRA